MKSYLLSALLIIGCLVSKAQSVKDTVYRDTVQCFINEYDLEKDINKYFLAYKLYWTYTADQDKYYVISYRTKDSTGAYKYYNPIRIIQSIDLATPKWYSLFNKNYKPYRIH